MGWETHNKTVWPIEEQKCILYFVSIVYTDGESVQLKTQILRMPCEKMEYSQLISRAMFEDRNNGLGPEWKPLIHEAKSVVLSHLTPNSGADNGEQQVPEKG